MLVGLKFVIKRKKTPSISWNVQEYIDVYTNTDTHTYSYSLTHSNLRRQHHASALVFWHFIQSKCHLDKPLIEYLHTTKLSDVKQIQVSMWFHVLCFILVRKGVFLFYILINHKSKQIKSVKNGLELPKMAFNTTKSISFTAFPMLFLWICCTYCDSWPIVIIINIIN